jgi:hypothetical protein
MDGLLPVAAASHAKLTATRCVGAGSSSAVCVRVFRCLCLSVAVVIIRIHLTDGGDQDSSYAEHK